MSIDTATAQRGTRRNAAVEIEDLRVQFRAGKETVYAVNGVTLSVAQGETLGIVGESGCGKSTAGFAMMRLLPEKITLISGRIIVAGNEIQGLPEAKLAGMRGRDIAMIYQDPMTSLNPVLRIGEQIVETLLAHKKMTRAAARSRASELLELVGIPDPEMRLDSYPHEISGGMRQRVMIAMAVALEPKVLIADEPTTALDVTTQAQILQVLKTLSGKTGTALVMITHDLGVVAGTTSRVAVMYAGHVIEHAMTETLFAEPRHPYTVGLMRAVPRIGSEDEELVPISGSPPDQREMPVFCPFAPRCRWRVASCWNEVPPLVAHGEHEVACFNPVLSKEAEVGVPLRDGFGVPPPSRDTKAFRSAIAFEPSGLQNTIVGG
ncbi:ABC transporter ATP-binding protein [Pararhizobium arenae]|uniref:ABC transporter ATP-binding protein n=1 Tax=Pararhizobium arenae TaxID=1856850 RepID=UPI0009FA9D43|nr:ABC transporter ATP-binding protein [Pararhizobium arenae]